FLPKFGVSLEASSKHIEIEGDSLLKKRIRLSLAAPCLAVEGVRACFSSFELDVTFTIYPFHVDAIQRLEAAGGDIEITPGKTDETPEREGVNPLDYLRKLTWEKIDLEVGKFVYHLEDDDLQLTAVMTGVGEGNELKVGASAAGQLKNAGLKFDASAEILGQAPLIEAPWTGGLRARLRQPSSEMDLQMDLEAKGTEPRFELDWAWTKPKGPSAHVRWKGRILEDAIKGELSGSVAKKKVLVAIAAKDPCAVGVFFDGRYELKCPVRVPVNPEFVKIRTGVPIPDTVGLVVDAKIQNAFPPSLAQTFKGDVVAELVAVETGSFRAKGNTTAKFEFLVSDLPKFRALDSHVNFDLELFSFENLAVDLSATEFAIPAPFHILQGAVKVKVEGGRLDPERADLPFKWETRLTSKTQKVLTEGAGRFVLKLQRQLEPHLEADAVLSDVRLNLPRVEWLELRNPPQVVPDSRLKREAPAGPPSKFSYRIGVKTTRPLELNSNLAAAPIPISIALEASKADSIVGTIAVEKFPLEIFRRRAELTKLEIKFGKLEAEDTIDAEVQVAYTDYTVFVKVHGPLDKPVVDLESQPPLPKRQLISALIFGKPPNELDADQKSSV
ncbi:MAG: translocation/assembly module TamB domain-containing protein, partial [Bdellovibrionia bacterium]